MPRRPLSATNDPLSVTKQSKLVADDVRAIRRRIESGETHRALAEEYNVGRSTIASIQHRRSWAYLD